MTFCALSDLLADMEDAEMRLAPDETAYIVNLTGDEAKLVLAATGDGAETLFETSVSCIGASICQVGVRDSQALLSACVHAVREAPGSPTEPFPRSISPDVPPPAEPTRLVPSASAAV